MSRVETIGNATLYLGDCLEILPTLPKVDAAWVDPPYNVGMDYGTHDDNMPEVEYEAWCDEWLSQLMFLCGERIAVYPPKYRLPWFWQRIPKSHLVVCTWSPEGAMHGKWAHQYAPLLLPAPKKKTKDAWHNCQMPGLGYFYREDRYGHPGRTSDDVTRRVVDAITERGETVIDCFMGSGTTGVACMNLGRKFIGVEIEPKYFEIACERIDRAQRQERLFA